MAYVPSSGSVVSYQITPSSLLSGSSIFGQLPAGTAMLGSIAAIITFPANQSISGAITAPAGSVMNVVNPAGSVATVIATIPAGSITAITHPAGSVTGVRTDNASVIAVLQANSIVGTYQEETIGGPSVRGIAIVWESNTSTSVMSTISPTNPLRVSGSVSGRVEATQPAGSLMTIITPAASITSVTNPAGSVTTVIATNPAASITSVTNPAGSVTTVIATAPAGSIMSTNQPAGSVLYAAVGSVAAFIVGSASIITVWKDSSVISVGTFSPSIYGMRSDALTSVLGADATVRPIATDAVGRILTKPFAGEQACIISYQGSIVSGSVQLIQASVIGSRSYITDFALSNTGSTTTLVTIQGGDTSVLGNFIVPGGGGNNKEWQIPLRTTLSQDLAFKVSPSQSILYVVVKGYQAP